MLCDLHFWAGMRENKEMFLDCALFRVPGENIIIPAVYKTVKLLYISINTG
jgi:hypothetical protein